MNTCYVSQQIAEHCNQDEGECPMCSESLEEKSNLYGEWLECTDCDYETEQK